MHSLRDRRVPAVVALTGALLLGWSVGGVAAVDRDLQGATAGTVPVSTASPTCHHDHRER